MADSKISQLTAIVEIDNANDSLAIVDQSTATTKKVTPAQLQEALGVPATTDELAEGSTNLYLTTERVQDIVGAEIVGGEDINATYSDLAGTVTVSLGTGIAAEKIADGTVSNVEFQYIGGLTSDAQTQIDGKQATLVSGTNIKTINSTSLLGSGDITISGGSPAGTAGQIQFTDGSAFAADSNLFWDNTNKRLGVGTSTPNSSIETTGGVRLSGSGSQTFEFSAASLAQFRAIFGGFSFRSSTGVFISNTDGTPTARLQVKGTGSTSATTSLLVQNSSGTAALTVKDDLSGIFTGIIDFQNNVNLRGANFTQSNLNMRFVVPGTTKTFLINADYGDTNAPSAILEVQSTTKGFLPPKMTTTQKNAISTPAAGLMVYDTDTNKLCCYNGTTWNDLF